MASIFKRARSPFFWIKWRDPVRGILRESTGIRIDAPDGKQKVNLFRAQKAVRELSGPKVRGSERWESWARGYFAARYEGTGSLKNALVALADLLVFFAEFEAIVPRLVTYDLAGKFMDWRKSARTLPKVHHNTARLRFSYLNILMSEAVRRGFADFNPCREIAVKGVAKKVKLEISADDQAKIESLLPLAKAWMQEQWLVLMRQGCRIAETIVPLERIDEKRMTITLRLKGGKLHTAPLHPDLLPLVARARAEKRPTLVVVPPSHSTIWGLWFRAHGLPYSAHCTRVTVITRLLRADHSPAKVCAFIGHSEEVNVIYRRLNPPDARELLATLSSSPRPASRRPGRKGSPRAISGRG